MQALHGWYAQGFNKRYGRTGHVFEGRFGSVPVTTDEQLWTTTAYIALNPVTAGLCPRPELWPWSSHRATLAGIHPAWLDAARLCSYFGGLGADPRQRYAAFVEQRRQAIAAEEALAQFAA
jgi:hypothetical protein